MFLWTAFHESCHTLAAVGLGGDLLEFSIWPSVFRGHFAFGHVVYDFESYAKPRSYWLIGAAPYFGDTLVALADPRRSGSAAQ